MSGGRGEDVAAGVLLTDLGDGGPAGAEGRVGNVVLAVGGEMRSRHGCLALLHHRRAWK